MTPSNMDRQLLRQKVCQKISVMKKTLCVSSSFWHFNSRFVLKTTKTPVFVCFIYLCLFSLLRFSDKLSDVIVDDPYLTS